MSNMCRGGTPWPFVSEQGRPRSAAPTKCVYVIVFFLVVSACTTQSNPAATDPAPPDTIVSSTPPFQTKEPERYQAIRTITIVTNDGKTVVTKTSIARDGDHRRHETEILSKRLTYLYLPEARFVLMPDDKVYADVAGEIDASVSEDEEITPERLLHSEAGTTSYQNLGKEVVGGRNSIKYKTIVNSSSAGNVSQSETLIWIDEELNMPVRSETTSADGTRITMELSDVKLDVDKRIFQVPDDYERIAFKELRRRMTTSE